MENAAAIVVTQGLTKTYGKVTALADCTLSVQRGDVFGLLGPNGSGKTTLLRLLMGFLRSTAGRALIENRDCYHESMATHALLSYLPGDVRLFRGMKGRDVLTFLAHLRGQPNADRTIQLADRLGLDFSRRVSNMSTGMRQKLALAAALAVDAPLLILDEPTSNLDPTVRATVTSLIREARASGRTVIFSSHVLSEVEQSCDRVVILRSGRLVYDQVISQVRRRHRIRARLTGQLPAAPENLQHDLSIVQNADGSITIDAPADLSPLLSWLAKLPLAEVHIEPIGLQAIYEQYHPPEAAA